MAATASLAPVSDEPTLSHTSYGVCISKAQMRHVRGFNRESRRSQLALCAKCSAHQPHNQHCTRERPYQDVFPVFACQILVRRFHYDIIENIRLRTEHCGCLLRVEADCEESSKADAQQRRKQGETGADGEGEGEVERIELGGSSAARWVWCRLVGMCGSRAGGNLMS